MEVRFGLCILCVHSLGSLGLMSGWCRKHSESHWKMISGTGFGKLATKVMWQFDLMIAAKAYSVNYMEVHGWDGHGWKTAEFQHLFNRIDISLWLHLTAVMGLVLAGCYPLICVLAVLPFTFSSLVALPLHWQVWRYVVRGTYQRWFWVQTVAPVVVSWFLVLTHWVRFSARVKAIRDTWRSRRIVFFLEGIFHFQKMFFIFHCFE